MSNYFVIDEAGNVHDLPECEVCGAPIYRPGLCGGCAQWFQSVESVTPVSIRVVVPDSKLLNPEDLQ